MLVRGGEIAEIGHDLESPGEVIDGEGKHLFPGFVDPHVHLRVPGQEHKEDLETGTRAAAAGGFVADRRDAEHRPRGRLGADPALAARVRAARGARPRRLPRLRHPRAAGRGADRDGRVARVRRARLHRRRQARPPRRPAAQGAAVPEARGRDHRPARGGPDALRARRHARGRGVRAARPGRHPEHLRVDADRPRRRDRALRGRPHPHPAPERARVGRGRRRGQGARRARSPARRARTTSR